MVTVVAVPSTPRWLGPVPTAISIVMLEGAAIMRRSLTERRSGLGAYMQLNLFLFVTLHSIMPVSEVVVMWCMCLDLL